MHSVDQPRPSRQRGPHNDPTLLDGDSAHGSPDIEAGDEWAVDTDTDVVDQPAADVLDAAVADPAPETEDEIDAFEAGAEPDAVTASPPAGERVNEDEQDDEIDEEDLAAEGIEGAGEAEGLGEPTAAEGSDLEAEIDRQLDATPDPAPAQVAPPIDGYDALTVPEVLARAKDLEVGQLNAVLEYERANRNRKTLVAKLARRTTEA
jgi:hypothetical protein